MSTKTRIEICGNKTERSFEDRSVYLSINTGPIESEQEAYMGGNLTTFLQAEDAITFGEALIRHGKRSLIANMINHQAIHQLRRLHDFCEEGRVERLVFTVVNNNPKNYGKGFRKYNITPIFRKGMEPQFEEGFSFEDIIYWSPFEEEFKQQKQCYGLGVTVELVGYDRKKELEDFEEEVRKSMGGGN